MKDKPQFRQMKKGMDFRDDVPGYFTVVQIRSDGKNFTIEFCESLIPYFTNEVLEKFKFVLQDAFYRVRPDLQKQ